MRINIVLFLLSVAVSMSAATVTTTAECTLSGSVIVNSSACALLGPGNSYGKATSAASFSTAANWIATSTQATDSAESALYIQNGNMAGSLGGASSTFVIDTELQTAGPVRNGFIQISQSAQWLFDEPAGFAGNMAWTLGQMSGGCTNCSSHLITT